MIVAVVLVLATLVFRALGALGVRRFASWPVSAAHGMAVMLLFTASAHFVPAERHGDAEPRRHGPDGAAVPAVRGRAGLRDRRTGTARRGRARADRDTLAGRLGLAALFVTLLPANIYAAVADISFANGEPATPLWQRIPEQILYIAVALWAARSAPDQYRRSANCSTQPRKEKVYS